MNKSDTQFPEKYKKKLASGGFMDEADAMDEAQLKKAIFECEANTYTIEKEQEENTKLNATKELLKELSAPYKDAKSYQTAKIKYCLFVLEGRGVSLDHS